MISKDNLVLPENKGEKKLDLSGALILIFLCMIWGVNGVAIKISNKGISPLFAAGVRSVIGCICLSLWMKPKGMSLFSTNVLDGAIAGFLFGLEFAFLFCSLLYTTVSATWIFLYSAPIFTVIGAHYFLEGEKLNMPKIIGSILGFSGILVLLGECLGFHTYKELLGDGLALLAGLSWAATTIFIKGRLVGRFSPYHTLFYQIIFFMPMLFLLSLIFREKRIYNIDELILISMGYQGIIVTFISLLIWFFLIHTYQVSQIMTFSFLTPIFATFAGILLLKESLTFRLIFSLALVCLGIYIMNQVWQPHETVPLN